MAVTPCLEFKASVMETLVILCTFTTFTKQEYRAIKRKEQDKFVLINQPYWYKSRFYSSLNIIMTLQQRTYFGEGRKCNIYMYVYIYIYMYIYWFLKRKYGKNRFSTVILRKRNLSFFKKEISIVILFINLFKYSTRI